VEGGESVFVNCPLDDDYRDLFYALLFAIHDCGYLARCALETDNAGQVRIDKVMAAVPGVPGRTARHV